MNNKNLIIAGVVGMTLSYAADKLITKLANKAIEKRIKELED